MKRVAAYLDKDGYRLIKRPDHPHADNKGYVREHRLVVESVVGRLLDPTEDVHHVDGDKLHNKPDNLELFASRAEHIRMRHAAGGRKSWFKLKTHCIRGHELAGSNLYRRKDEPNTKCCRICRYAAVNKHILSKKETKS